MQLIQVHAIPPFVLARQQLLAMDSSMRWHRRPGSSVLALVAAAAWHLGQAKSSRAKRSSRSRRTSRAAPRPGTKHQLLLQVARPVMTQLVAAVGAMRFASAC